MSEDIVARMSIDIDPYMSGLRKSVDSTEKAAQDINRHTRLIQTGYNVAATGVKALGVAVAGLAAVVSAGAFKAMEAVDANVKLADSLGMTMRATDAMRLVFQEAGIEQGRMTASLAIMQRNLFEAARGSENQSKALKVLGLDINDLLKLSPDKQFEKIATALAQVENPTLKAGLATQIFGRGARELNNVLEDYSSKVADAEAYNDKFGLSISRIDAAKIEQANDAFGRVRSAVGGLSNAFAIELAPVIEGVSIAILDGAFDAQTWSEAVRASIDAVAKALDGLVNMIRDVGQVWTQTTNFLGDGMARAYAYVSGNKDLIPHIGADASSQRQSAWEKYLASSRTSVTDSLERVRRDSQATAERTAARRPGGAEYQFDAKGSADAEASLGRVKKAMDGLKKSTKDTEKGFENMFSNLKSWAQSGELTFKSFTKAILGDLMEILTADRGRGQGSILGSFASSLFSGFRLPSFDVGAYNLSQDQIAKVHKGEMIFPASVAERIRSGGFGGGSSVNNTYIYNNAGAQVSTQERTNTSGGRDLMVTIDEMVSNVLADPSSRSSRALRKSSGLRPSLTTR